jgi:hypothetical protein
MSRRKQPPERELAKKAVRLFDISRKIAKEVPEGNLILAEWTCTWSPESTTRAKLILSYTRQLTQAEQFHVAGAFESFAPKAEWTYGHNSKLVFSIQVAPEYPKPIFAPDGRMVVVS